jgi:hypothetical protein
MAARPNSCPFLVSGWGALVNAKFNPNHKANVMQYRHHPRSPHRNPGGVPHGSFAGGMHRTKSKGDVAADESQFQRLNPDSQFSVFSVGFRNFVLDI